MKTKLRTGPRRSWSDPTLPARRGDSVRRSRPSGSLPLGQNHKGYVRYLPSAQVAIELCRDKVATLVG